MRVFEIIRNEAIADKIDSFQFIAALRHDFFDLRRMIDIYSDDPAFRRVQISLEPKKRAVVFDESVGGVHLAEQFDDFRIWLSKILIKDALLRIGALGNGNDEIVAVVGYLGVEQPVLMIFALVDQRILRLRRPD